AGVLGVVSVGSAGVVALAGTQAGTVPLSPAGAPESGMPPAMAALYREAAPVCPGLSWTILAAIGTVESSNGTSHLPGVRAGANPAGAEGPMQFLPATFAAYSLPVPPGGADPPSPYDPTDAVYAAARMLCADGARDGADVSGAVYAYDHSPAYVAQVLSVAAAYAAQSS
ncbi:MAG: lytic transglycosylase domain-containing protein, partial [Acidobacteriota bacterium]|nr:lytic transglycosylase domain-containing protein [Acidobacteriota bacterium]